MLSKELLSELVQLNRAEKLQVVQLLVNKLAEEEVVFQSGVEYPIYTPPGNEAAAQVLWEVLQAAKASDESGT